MQINWTEIIIVIVSIVLTGVIIPLVKSKLDADKLRRAQVLTKAAVEAAEQIFAHGDNETKYEYVATYLADAGINLDAKTIKMLIESSVQALKEFNK